MIPLKFQIAAAERDRAPRDTPNLGANGRFGPRPPGLPASTANFAHLSARAALKAAAFFKGQGAAITAGRSGRSPPLLFSLQLTFLHRHPQPAVRPDGDERIRLDRTIRHRAQPVALG